MEILRIAMDGLHREMDWLRRSQDHMYDRQDRLDARISRIEQRPVSQPRPMSEWVTLITSLAILAAATFGKLTWADALPSLTGLVGH